MRKTAWTAVIVIVLGALGYFLYSATQSSAPVSQPTEIVATPAPTPTPTPVKQITVDLKAAKNSTQSGTAMLKEENDKVMVSLDLMNAPKGIVQPAHIHTGSCPNVGAVKYPLTSPVNGRSETTLDTTFDQLKTMLPLAINVHKSATQSSTYVSCGDLTF